MIKNFILSLLCLAVFTFNPQKSFAQGEGTDDIFAQSMNDIITVGACGGIGAVLGLSTLSFVDEPGDHLKNIVVGGAIGIIIGVGVVAYKQANVSKDVYQNNAFLSPSQTPEMTTAMRNSWHSKNHYQINDNLGKDNATSMPGVNFQFSF
jgi:hypothetical protein